jgi:tRNA (cmo5U34)-methyltransferase
MNKITNRYSESAEEDRLFYLITPHLDKFQNVVAFALRKYFAESLDKKNVLELGCGSGITSQIILINNPNIILSAIDNDEEVLKQAHEKLAKYEKEGRLKFQYSDMYDYLKTQSDDSSDAIVSALALHNCDVKYRKKVYKEIFRILKNGGIFVNADKFVSDDETEHKQALDWQLSQFDNFEKYGRLDLKQKWTEHYYQDEASSILLREGDFVKDLAVIGFSNIQKIFREKMEAIYIANKSTD